MADVSAPIPTGTPAQYNSRGPQYVQLCTSWMASNLQDLPSDGMILDWISKQILPPEDKFFRHLSQEPRPVLPPPFMTLSPS